MLLTLKGQVIPAPVLNRGCLHNSHIIRFFLFVELEPYRWRRGGGEREVGRERGGERERGGGGRREREAERERERRGGEGERERWGEGKEAVGGRRGRSGEGGGGREGMNESNTMSECEYHSHTTHYMAGLGGFTNLSFHKCTVTTALKTYAYESTLQIYY
jgi:hypothetical protein